MSYSSFTKISPYSVLLNPWPRMLKAPSDTWPLFSTSWASHSSLSVPFRLGLPTGHLAFSIFHHGVSTRDRIIESRYNHWTNCIWVRKPRVQTLTLNPFHLCKWSDSPHPTTAFKGERGQGRHTCLTKYLAICLQRAYSSHIYYYYQQHNPIHLSNAGIFPQYPQQMAIQALLEHFQR